MALWQAKKSRSAAQPNYDQGRNCALVTKRTVLSLSRGMLFGKTGSSRRQSTLFEQKVHFWLGRNFRFNYALNRTVISYARDVFTRQRKLHFIIKKVRSCQVGNCTFLRRTTNLAFFSNLFLLREQIAEVLAEWRPVLWEGGTQKIGLNHEKMESLKWKNTAIHQVNHSCVNQLFCLVKKFVLFRKGLL